MIGMNREIKYDSDLHRNILAALCERKKLSEDRLDGKWTQWRKADEDSVAYLKETDADKIRKDRKRGQGDIDYTAIHVPYSTGMMLSAHTYLTSVFLGRDPVQQFTARHGEPQEKVLAVEALMGYQNQVGQHTIPYYIWIYDALKYGVGVVFTHWAEESERVAEIVEEESTFAGIPMGKKKKRKITKEVQGYHGNRLFNVRPYDYLPDPRVPINQPQNGEFVGRMFDIPWNDIVIGAEKGHYFNMKEAKNSMASKGKDEHGSSALTIPDAQEDTLLMLENDKGYGRGMEMVIRLIPKDWRLGEGTLPEKWVFTVINERVIIGCRPLGEYHNKFPCSVLEMDIDGYQLVKRGMLEQMEGMNDIVTWLFNSHFYNVRAAMNNQFILDPSKVTMKDMMSGEPGFMARLKPDAYGTDVRTAFAQVPVQDVTQSHMGNLDMVGQLMQRTFGVTDPVMGVPSQKNRQTATETRTNAGFGVSRLKTTAEYMSAMGWQPLSQMMLQSTQQHYSLERKYRIMGDLTSEDPFVNVTPDDIAGFYDFVPVDGTLPVDRFAQANLWKEILQALRQMPDLAVRYDLAGIFAWMAQLAGMRNINQFKVQMDDPAEIKKQADAGNLVALQQGPQVPGPQGRGGAQGAEPKQVSRVGPTG